MEEDGQSNICQNYAGWEKTDRMMSVKPLFHLNFEVYSVFLFAGRSKLITDNTPFALTQTVVSPPLHRCVVLCWCRAEIKLRKCNKIHGNIKLRAPWKQVQCGQCSLLLVTFDCILSFHNSNHWRQTLSGALLHCQLSLCSIPFIVWYVFCSSRELKSLRVMDDFGMAMKLGVSNDHVNRNQLITGLFSAFFSCLISFLISNFIVCFSFLFFTFIYKIRVCAVSFFCFSC